MSMKVLLVDDEQEYRETLGKRLGKRGLTVEKASSGEEALEKLAAFPADVVVLDVKMTGMDGLTTLHKIKAGWPTVEVIMLTGHASVEVAIRGLELGAYDYLMKPVDIKELFYKLEDACARRARQEDGIRLGR